MSRRGQTNARTSSRRVPILLAIHTFLASSLAPSDRDDQVRSVGQVIVGHLLRFAVVRESAFLVSCVCPRSRRAAPRRDFRKRRRASPLRPANPFSLPALLPSPIFSLRRFRYPRRFAASPHADLLPPFSSLAISFFFPSPHVLFLSSPSRFRHPRFAAPAACRKPPISTYLPILSYPILSLFLFPSSSFFRARVDTVPRPVHKTFWRYLLPTAVAEKETQYFMETDRYWGVHYRYCPALRGSISRGRGNGTTGMTVAA